MFRCCAVAIPGGESTGQDALDGAAVELFEDLGKREVFSPRVLSLVMCFVGRMVFDAELLSMNSFLT
jgi:hypothetical protein